MNIQPIGRFAPTPSGALHIGSLLTAVASFVDIRSQGGLWRVRMEDIDPPREVEGAADDILRTLEAFSLFWDGDVLYQHTRLEAYRAALDDLQGRIYPCTCTRRMQGKVYNGHCRVNLDQNRSQYARYAVRVVVPDIEISFNDSIVGHYQEHLARNCGDFILRRADGLWAYQWAVVLDDAYQHINQVMRGQDLLSSTPRQIFLQRALNLPTPQYAHLPLLTNALGQKWSKQTRAPRLDLTQKEVLMQQVLRYLNVADEIPDMTCAELLEWAIAHWNRQRIPCSTINTEKGCP